jgi:hypothetical protein
VCNELYAERRGLDQRNGLPRPKTGRRLSKDADRRTCNTTIAAMTNATVTNIMMRLINITILSWR